MERAPQVDPRSPGTVRGELLRLLNAQVPAWSELDAATGRPTGASAALIAAFTRLTGILIDRLNRAPDKNHLVFLDLLGASRTSPRAARVPLIFTLARGGPERVVVPEGTQVAAESPESGGSPPVFETEGRLEIVATELDAVCMRDPATDRYTSRIPTGGVLTDPPSLFRGDEATSHQLYIRHDELLSQPAEELRLDIELEPGPSSRELARDPWSVRWEVWDGDAGIPLEPFDATSGLKKSGLIRFRDTPEAPVQTVGGVEGRWLRCTLETPVTAGAGPLPGMVRARALPAIRRVGMRQELRQGDLAPQRAFANRQPLDLTKDFFPFGDAPRFGDTFYLAGEEAFSIPRSRVTLRLELTNPTTGPGESPLPRTKPSPDLELQWEAWNGELWEELGVASPDGTRGSHDELSDTTAALSRSGLVTFVLPPTISPTDVHGVTDHWIRVRIVAGDYGKPAGYQARPSEENRPELDLLPGTPAPPAIRLLTMEQTAVREAANPQTALACNDFSWTDGTDRLQPPGAAWTPFDAMEDRASALYLGFRTNGETPRFPGRSVSLWLRLGRLDHHGPQSTRQSGDSRIVWEYWGSEGWTPALVRDETDGLRRSGALAFIVPQDFVPSSAFGRRRHWLRAVLVFGDSTSFPDLHAAYHNVVWASDAITVRDETLGSSDGKPVQRFRTRLAPVLPGEHLVVRSSRPEAAHGWDAWHPVPDFHGSGPADRHYVLDRLSGEVRFGDGRHGAIPPAGRGNVRMACYRTGGGARGDISAGVVSRLQTTVPYVDEVTNPEPVRGGAEAEDLDGVRRRASRALRHRDRAVAAGDYEDLALEATHQVARAACLESSGHPPGPSARVRIVVVPRSTEPAPFPDPELIQQVTQYLVRRCACGVALEVRGPRYIRVDVEASLAIVSPRLAADVEAAARRGLERFLHPLEGGREGEGWPFGRVPQRSDIKALLASLAGVDRVVALDLEMREPPEPGELLVRSGRHRIHLTSPGTRPAPTGEAR